MPACRYVEENSLAAMLAAKRLAGVTPEVNHREHVTCMPLPSANKVAHSGSFETSPVAQNRSINGPKKGLCPPKIFKKRFDLIVVAVDFNQRVVVYLNKLSF